MSAPDDASFENRRPVDGMVDHICYELRQYASAFAGDKAASLSESDFAMARAWMFESANVLEKAREVMQRMDCYGKQSLTDEELLFLGVFTAGGDSDG